MQVNVAAVEAVNWEAAAKELDLKSPLEIMDHVGISQERQQSGLSFRNVATKAS